MSDIKMFCNKQTIFFLPLIIIIKSLKDMNFKLQFKLKNQTKSSKWSKSNFEVVLQSLQ